MFELAVPRKLMATGSNDNGRADSKESKNTYVGMHGLKLNEQADQIQCDMCGDRMFQQHLMNTHEVALAQTNKLIIQAIKVK